MAWKKSVRWILNIVYAAVFLYAATSLIQLVGEYYSNQKVLASVQEVYIPKQNDDNPTKSGVRKSFEPLMAINRDIIGWINIDDTKVNYPVLQSTDNEYYLHHNYEKGENLAGSIFMDYHNDAMFPNKHTILYGHRMKDGTMFSQIKKYEKQAFFNEHPTFSFDTVGQSYTVEVFSAYVTTTDFDYIQTDFTEDRAFINLVEEMHKNSSIQTAVKVSKEDRIITLSTCDYIYDDGRFVVHGILRSN